MKTAIISIDPLMPAEPDSNVSFGLFKDFITGNIDRQAGIRKTLYSTILDAFKKYPQLSGPVSMEDAGRHEEILQLIAAGVMPMMEEENERLWAFGKTFSPRVFHGSEAFYKLIGSVTTDAKEAWIDKEEVIRVHNELKYSFILEKIYDIRTFFNKDWIHRMLNPDTGLYRYYRVSVDWRFSGIKIKGKLPEFRSHLLESCGTRKEEMALLQQHLPLHLFEGTGFTIISLVNVTPAQTLEQMAKISIDDDEIRSASSLRHVNLLLQTIVESNACQFGIMPFLSVNQRPALLYGKYPFSIIASACWKKEVPKSSFASFMEFLQVCPGTKVYHAGSENDSFPPEIQQALQHAGIKFYMSVPAYYDNRLVGMLEVSSFQDNTQLSEPQIAALRPAMHVIAKISQQIINKFDRQIEYTIRDKFTNIQPSVQWKFNEVAWHYLRNNYSGAGKEAVENIGFPDVYPIYGAVDIRNSTVERNRMLREDIKIHVHLLKRTLLALPDQPLINLPDTLFNLSDRSLPNVSDGPLSDPSGETKIARIEQSCDNWLNKCSDGLDEEDETAFNIFLRDHIDPFLQTILQRSREIPEISFYYTATEKETGFVFDNRRKLEASMKLVNNAVNQFYEEARESLQNIYPCYFDKFRTDGVEYDIYTGPSIAPKIPFDKQHLWQFRSWQVRSMASIARVTNTLLSQMPVPMKTTQLIFVHSRTIDICFRNDERRFDVEGSYNIRYQVVKKRIDKAKVRNTDQRLTQPGKIAIVYSNREDADEYLAHIRLLQQENILLDDLEYLELQELQGVSGLLALRVGVGLLPPSGFVH